MWGRLDGAERLVQALLPGADADTALVRQELIERAQRGILREALVPSGELTAQDLARFRPAHEVLPAALQEELGMRRRGPQKGPTKASTTIRFDADVLKELKATRPGWQTRANDLLRASLVLAGRLG